MPPYWYIHRHDERIAEISEPVQQLQSTHHEVPTSSRRGHPGDVHADSIAGARPARAASSLNDSIECDLQRFVSDHRLLGSQGLLPTRLRHYA